VKSDSARVFERLKDQWTRLNSLYWIIDIDSKRVKFQLNDAQTWLFDNMWYFNIILKARQLGFTTFIDLFMLDTCLFNSNVESGIIAHREEDAKKIFERKIKYPYENLPDIIRDARPSKTNRNDELKFNNGSWIYVAYSMRSGTTNMLHLSELARVCARDPLKATEIITGSLNAIHLDYDKDNLVFIESTAEGQEGYFFDYCKLAQDFQRQKVELSPMDPKFFFRAWWQHPSNTVKSNIPLTAAEKAYFARLEPKIGIKLTDGQKAWYAAKKRVMPEDMMRENPSTPEEAFQASGKGSYYAAAIAKLREKGHICKVPHEEGFRVNTYWDLGMSDSTAIWFGQTVLGQYRFIDYYENSGEGLKHYANVLDEKSKKGRWVYGRHVAPHDIKVRELGTGKTRLETAMQYGLRFRVAPKIESMNDGIEAVRNVLPNCWFDESSTIVDIGRNRVAGLPSLDAYRKEWDEKGKRWKDRPMNNWAGHGAKAFETFAITCDTQKKWDNLERAFR